MIKYLYWFIIPILFILQLIFVLQSNSQVRFEEMYESAKSVYLLNHHLIGSGLHEDVGWYGLVLIVGKLFGYGLNTGKLLKLPFFLAFIISLAIIFKRYLEPKLAALMLLAIGLSPTILFYNTLNLHNGFDFVFLPILLVPLLFFNPERKLQTYLVSFFVFLIAMFASLVYPAFLFYIPSLGLLFLIRIWKKTDTRAKIIYICITTVGFLLPLLFLFSWVSNKDIIINDPATQTGLWRTGGKVTFNEDTTVTIWTGIVKDLFIGPTSSNYEVNQTEFNDVYPAVGMLIILFLAIKLPWKNKQSKLVFGLIWLVIFCNLLLVSTGSDYAIVGIRRALPTVIMIYAFGAAILYFGKKEEKAAGILALGLILVHHLISYPINLQHLSDPSPYQVLSFMDQGKDPSDSLNKLVMQVQTKPLALDCRPELKKYTQCEYSFVFSAIQNECDFNHLSCHKITAFDVPSGQWYELNLQTFNRSFNE